MSISITAPRDLISDDAQPAVACRRAGSCAYGARNRWRMRRRRGQGRALGECGAGQRQARHQRLLPRHPARQVRAALSGRSCLPLQPPISPRRAAAATGARHGAVQALARAEIARSRQLSWLSVVANQEIVYRRLRERSVACALRAAFLRRALNARYPARTGTPRSA